MKIFLTTSLGKKIMLPEREPTVVLQFFATS